MRRWLKIKKEKLYSKSKWLMLGALRGRIGKVIDRMLVPVLFRTNDGTYVLREKWNNMIILDACRYDAFERVYEEMGINGKLEYRFSRGATTSEFLIENFGKGKFEDIIYITANPIVSDLLKGNFYKIVPVWKQWWDEKADTVPPFAVYNSTLEVLRKYPNKKLIIHFMQPHCPYPNGTGAYRTEKSLFGEVQYCKIDEDRIVKWKYIRIKPIEVNKLLEGYYANLKLVMPYVKKLVNILPGRIVVTADHGEAFGEKIHPLLPIKFYSHHARIRIPTLVKVPWLIVKGKEKIGEREILRLKIKELKKSGNIT